MSTVAELSSTLLTIGHFETVSAKAEGPTQLRMVGRVNQAHIHVWRDVREGLLVAQVSPQAGWGVDISRMDVLKPLPNGSLGLFYAWRLIFFAAEDLSARYEAIIEALHALGRPALATRVEEIILPGATADRNAINERGKGARATPFNPLGRSR